MAITSYNTRIAEDDARVSRELISYMERLVRNECRDDSSTPSTSRPDAPAPSGVEKKKGGFDPMLIVFYPLMLINDLCAFILLCAFNVCIAIGKTFRGEEVK